MSGKKLLNKLAILLGLFLAIAFQTKAQEEATLEDVIEVYNEGATYANDNDYKSAIKSFENCVELADELGEEGDEYKTRAEGIIPNLYYKYTKELVGEQKYNDALTATEKTVKAAKEYNDEITLEKAQELIPQLHYQNAVAYYKANDLTNAIASIEKSLELDPSYTKAYYMQTAIYKKQENDEGMATIYAEASEKAGSDKTTLGKIQSIAYKYFLGKGNDAIQASKYDEAIVNLKKAIEIDGTDSDSYRLLLQSYSEKSDWASAIEIGTKALEIENDSEKKAGIYFMLGAAYYGNGDTDKACDAYSKAAVGKYEANANYQKEHVLKCAQ